MSEEFPISDDEQKLLSLDEQNDSYRQLLFLMSKRLRLLHQKKIAEQYAQTAQTQIDDLNAQIEEILDQFGEKDAYALAKSDPRLMAILAKTRHLIGQTTLTRPKSEITNEQLLQQQKEKEERREKEQKQQEEDRRRTQPQNSRPQQQQQKPDNSKPAVPTEQLSPDELLEKIRQKLSQKDPRKQKEGLKELQKPENQGLGKDDPEFAKLKKNAEKRVAKYDKIMRSIIKDLKELMQSNSDVVKKNISKLWEGKVDQGLKGLKEVGKSTPSRFNAVASAARDLCACVAILQKDFDIKPEEALSKEVLETAKPVITKQSVTKSRDDIQIDRNSAQNKVMGESKELSAAEREIYKKMAENPNNTSRVAADTISQREQAAIRNMIREDEQKPVAQINPDNESSDDSDETTDTKPQSKPTAKPTPAAMARGNTR